MNLKKLNKGFTLIEILVVIGIIAVLATIVIVAINPARQFAQARNTQRISNIEAILNAVGQRIADNKGIFEGSFGYKDVGTDTIKGTADDYYDNYCDDLLTTQGAITTEMGTQASGDKSGDLGCLVPTYISALPTDPTWKSTQTTPKDTLYTIVKDATTGRITICAPLGKEDALPDTTESTICVTR